MLIDGLDTGICTILPEACYPLEGVITIKGEKDNTVMVGEFCLYRGYEELNIKTNIRQVYFKKKVDKEGRLYCASSDFPRNHYKYELVAQTKIIYENTAKGIALTNVQINGVGKFSEGCEISVDDSADIGQVVTKFYPLHEDGKVCDLRAW